ncbi:RagB/SusD family nutrient uptake outer membrane protein [Rufibacter immobilis]|uniref:RagB/SusD family nutrient uptake outer membrane protein n=1 Tax=Rufibacter immobilis TaxID=1348778 RepID=A0A3M9MPG3_9BACT|nr:RagB/SusD family nutrient uptake outer membrane protein [Rufibacter immobilis]RNI27420.1 RagB/SusD family nutrient uptake outer membrane protein [Rufibacter immobilis]
MTTNILKKMVLAGVIAFAVTSCTDDLELTPKYEVTSASLYKDFANYKPVLAKVYGGYSLTGLKSDGAPDLSGFDEGKSNYIRAFWTLQELSTDEAVIAWSDVFPVHNMNWNSGTEAVRMMYDRIFYQIALCNEFLRNTTDAQLAENGITGNNLEEAKKYRAEVRFLRAMSYWHALDLYGNVPFVTEADQVGFFNPTQISRTELFNFVESELKAVEAELVAPRQNEYARADKAAAWMVLAKLYLNAQVYVGQDRNTDAVTYSKKVIDAGFSLAPQYKNLFQADNDRFARQGASPQEIILPVVFDGNRTRSYGGTTFLIHGSLGPEHNAADYGMNGGWGGLRTTPEIIDLFSTADSRAIYHTAGHTKEIESISNFANGYPLNKYTNVTSDGKPGSDPGLNFPDTDYPLFRLADAYLMYAEAVLRDGAGGDRAMALGYVNQLRERAFGNVNGNITDAQLTLDFILDERARELHWEGHRRTDLIRFGRFTSASYLWAWKGGVEAGRAVADYRRLYPIPASDLAANPNLKQNPGY